MAPYGDRRIPLICVALSRICVALRCAVRACRGHRTGITVALRPPSNFTALCVALAIFRSGPTVGKVRWHLKLKNRNPN